MHLGLDSAVASIRIAGEDWHAFTCRLEAPNPAIMASWQAHDIVIHYT